MSAADTGLEAVRQFLNLDVPLFVESAFHGLGGVADFATAAIGNMTLLADAMGTVGGAAPGGGAAAAVAHAVAPAGVGGTALTADLGNASVVGRLSVPASWSTAAPATAAGAALDGTGWAVPEEDGPIAVMPPAPGMVVAANSVGADSDHGTESSRLLCPSTASSDLETPRQAHAADQRAAAATLR